MIRLKNSVKKVLGCFAVISAAVLFIVRSESVAAGVFSSMKLCVLTVIPFLLPFMVLSNYVIMSGMASAAGGFFDRICRALFRLPGEAACIIIMSLIGGFPVGAKMIDSALENGILNKNQARRMQLFCVNAGPAFIINIVGSSMLHSRKAGVILLISTVLSSLTTGVVSRFFDKPEKKQVVPVMKESKGTALVESVENSVGSIITVCGWILVFGALRQIISDAALPDDFKLWSDLLFEVTQGCTAAVRSFPLPVTALVLGFSGFAVHAQIFPFLSGAGLRYRVFFTSRVINGALAAMYSGILFRLFPCDVQVFASDSQLLPVSFSVSTYASAAAIITCALIILDLAPTEKV